MRFTPFDKQYEAGTSEQLWRKGQMLEVSVFLFFIVPSMALSLFAVRQGQLGFVLAASAILLRDLALVCLILFFLLAQRRVARQDRLDFQEYWRETALGIVLFIPFFGGVACVELVLRHAGLTAPATPLPSFLTAARRPADPSRPPSGNCCGGVGGNDLPGIPPAPLWGNDGEYGRGGDLQFADFLPRPRLRGYRRARHCGRDGGRPGPRLSLATKSCSSDGYPLSAGFHWHRACAVIGTEMR